jgi:Intraflagellar transport protein 43
MFVLLYDMCVVAVAAAPKNTARRVPSLRELDHAIRYTIPSAAEGLDMSMLTNTLVPPDMVSNIKHI